MISSYNPWVVGVRVLNSGERQDMVASSGGVDSKRQADTDTVQKERITSRQRRRVQAYSESALSSILSAATRSASGISDWSRSRFIRCFGPATAIAQTGAEL